ncbi:MAG: hypothetical protein FOGNACKC_06238 [Anaerolineae bacterium]|nr:hypothetical protein [Anaerolineae bacterium]
MSRLPNITTFWLKNMADKPRILLDANIVLDVLARRDPHYAASAAVWALVEQGHADGFLAAHTLTTLHYLLSKYQGPAQAMINLTKLLRVFRVAGVDQAVIDQALAFGWADFEDAVQMAAAFNLPADYLITRNPKDFKDAPVRVLQPGDFLALHSPR